MTSRYFLRFVAAVLLVGLFSLLSWPASATSTLTEPTDSAIAPLAPTRGLDCEIAGANYELIPIEDEADDRPDNEHADLNLELRGYEETSAVLGLVEIDGPPPDAGAPQLSGLFANNRIPTFSTVYQVYGWDFKGCNCQQDLLSRWDVTLAGMATTQGETIHLPDREGGDIYQGRFKALVIYATSDRITLKYTRDDDVVEGYTIHVENICVDPNLVSLYRQGDDENGRTQLPALAAGQAFGVASGSEIGVVIRDAGSFMDPRSRRDWWQEASPTAITLNSYDVPSTKIPLVALTLITLAGAVVALSRRRLT